MIRTALLGYGWWGQHMARRLSDSARFELVGVQAPELAGDTTDMGVPVLAAPYEDVLARDDIDAVVLTTPNEQHTPQVLAAAKAGKHVFCEKPLALSGADARAMTAACAAAGVTLWVGHERRQEPALQALSAMVSQGDLGTVLHAEAAFSHDKLTGVPKGNWRTLPETAPAAGMTGMGIHLTDAFIWMFGPVIQVQAMTARRVLDWPTGDTVTVQLRFKAGMTATLSALLATPHFMRLQVFGNTSWAEVRNDTHPDTPGGQAHLMTQQTGHPLQTTSYDWTDTVVDNLNGFADTIEGRAAPLFTPDQMAHNIEVLEAIATAAKTGETVWLDR